MKFEKLNKCNLCESKDIFWVCGYSDICQCKNCGYIFENPRPTTYEIINYYSQREKYNSWLAEEKSRDVLWKRRLKLLKKYKSSGRLLDIGTGIGQFLHFARNDFEVVGTEISKSAIKIAKQKYNIDVIQGEIENINFNYKFDVITLFHVLEHVLNPSLTINKCKELLDNEGVLVIAVPNIDLRSKIGGLLLYFKMKKFRDYGRLGLHKSASIRHRNEIHLSYFTPSVLQEFLVKNGFIIIENILDPYYAAKGVKLTCHYLLYKLCLIISKIFKINLYYTILIIAKKY